MTLPTSSLALQAVSPTRLERLACPARVAFEQLGRAAPDQTDAARLGDVVHRSAELLVGGLAAEAAWDAACGELAGEGVDPAQLGGARRARLRFVARAPQILALVEEHAPSEPLIEVDLESGDGLLWGRADLILVGADALVVVDHKSGLVSHDRQTDAAYVRQIQFYAGLASERFGKPVRRGVVLSMRQGVVDVPVEPAAVAAVLDAARVAVNDFNARAPGPQPAEPAADRCRWCPHKARCDAFWQAYDASWVGALGHAVRGTATSPIEVASNERAAGRLDVERGSADVGSVTLTGVPSSSIAGWAPGARISITGVAIDEEHRVASWRPQSSICID